LTTTEAQSPTLQRIEELRPLCPEMRLGQVLATIAMLAEDATSHSLWDVEDQELFQAIERFAADLERRSQPPGPL
jgi:hypothetical protein